MQGKLKNILYILCGLCAFVLGMKQLREPDIWWQLLSGRWMIENGAITRTDMFSYTMAGQRWINVKWLYEILIGLLEKATGPEGVLLFQSLINVCIVYLLFQTIKHFTNKTKETVPVFAAAISILLFLAISEYRMAGRPEMISHLMCTLYLFILWRTPEMQWRRIWMLIPLQCIWANMHEGYPVGIVIIGACLGGSLLSYIIAKEKAASQQTVRASVLLAACILVILLNPNTTQLWYQPFEIYRQVWANKYTTELFSYKDTEYWTIQAKLHIALTVLVFAYWCLKLLAVNKARQTKAFFTPFVTAYLLLLPLFTYLSLTANRNIPFAQIVMLPSVAAALIWLVNFLKLDGVGVYKTLSVKAVPIAIAISIVFYISIVSNSYYKLTKSVNKYGIHISMLHNPTGAAEFIKTHDIKGTAFSDYFVSSYMLWHRFPVFRSYIDLRDLDVFPVSFFDDYFSIYNNPSKFDSLDAKYNFNYVVLSTSQLAGVQMKLFYGQDYNMIYVDPVAAIFLKSTPANAPLNSNLQIQKIFSWPPAIEDPAWAEGLTKLLNPLVNYDNEDETLQPIYAARFYNHIQNYPIAIKQLLPQMPMLEDNVDANLTMANTLIQYGNALKPGPDKQRKLDSAQIFLDKVRELDPSKLPSEEN